MTVETLNLWAGDVPVTMHAAADVVAQQREYLRGYLPGRVGDPELPGLELTVAHGDAGRAGMEEAAAVVAAGEPRRIEHIPGVVLIEGRSRRGVRWYTVEADAIEHRPAAFAVRADGPAVTLFEHDPLQPGFARPLRLIREAMLRTYEDHDGVVFHAAGADLDGLGVLVCGPRNAGKTSLLTLLCGRCGGAVLSNDRVILTPRTAGAARMVAVPLPVPVAPGTIETTPLLKRAIPLLSRSVPETLPAEFGTPVKAEFSPAEYTRALHTTMLPAATLTVVIVAALDDSASPPQIQRLSEPDAEKVLSRNCFTPYDEFWIEPWFLPRRRGNTELARAARALVREVAATVPVIRVYSGVHADPLQLTQLLRNHVEACR